MNITNQEEVKNTMVLTTNVRLRCSKRIKGVKCGLPLVLKHVDSDGGHIFECANGHRTRYTEIYMKRFGPETDLRGDLPQVCPTCRNPIRERSRTLQHDAKHIGKISCSRCNTELYFNPDTRRWEVAE